MTQNALKAMTLDETPAITADQAREAVSACICVGSVMQDLRRRNFADKRLLAELVKYLKEAATALGYTLTKDKP